jgi:hypothetical protein
MNRNVKLLNYIDILKFHLDTGFQSYYHHFRTQCDREPRVKGDVMIVRKQSHAYRPAALPSCVVFRLSILFACVSLHCFMCANNVYSTKPTYYFYGVLIII